jgi:hypothetical protein
MTWPGTGLVPVVWMECFALKQSVAKFSQKAGHARRVEQVCLSLK